MQPFSPYIAHHLGTMLDMAPRRLAKRLKCSAQNAERVQHLIMLIIVKRWRKAHAQDTSEIEVRAAALSKRMQRAREGELGMILGALAKR